MILNGIEKSALLLMSIGADQAAEILKHLTPIEVQELTTCMVNIKQFSNKILNQVLCECHDLARKNNTLHQNNGNSYLIDMLTKALGEIQGNSLLKEALEIRDAKIYIKSLNRMNPEKVAVLLDKEHLQVITIILIYLDHNQSAKILSYLSDQKRAEIILRITEFNGIQESSLIELKKVVNNLLKSKTLILSDKGGIKTAAGILNSMKIQHKKNTIKKISIVNKQLADTIIKEIFLFKNIVDLDDKHIKFVIENIEQEKLCIALQKSDLNVREKFFKNMSKQNANKLYLSLEKKSYISDISIKNEQKLILIMIKSIVDNRDVSLNTLRDYYV